jgi:hypothetical protein
MLLIVALVAVVCALLTLLLPRRNVRPPRFISGAPASIAAHNWINYGWLADVPFQNDRIWLQTLSGTNFHVYLYDLRSRTITGELFDGGSPQLSNRDGSRILVTGHGSTETAAQTMLNVFRKMVRAPLLGDRIETFWILDLPSNTATKVGIVSQARSAGSTWHPSPDFRYGYTLPTTAVGEAISLYDFERRSFTKIFVPGYPVGWWDERTIVIDSLNDDFDLFDVQTRTARVLFSAAQIKTFFARAGITNAVRDIYPFFNWNGTNYDFFFGPKNKTRGLHGDGFLLKVNRAGPSLELLSTNFGYRWGGVFDRSATHYLFPGESGTPGRSGDGSVCLRDLSDGKITTIVPPDNKGRYSLPKFYGTEVIYLRDRMTHRIGLDGSNDALVLTNN